MGSVDCDEFAMATTHESGGYPKSVNLVTSGSKCAQLFADKMGDGSANIGILADTRTAMNGPSGPSGAGVRQSRAGRTNRCSANSRLRRGGCWTGFFLTLPGFEHCTSTATTCTWRKIG
ncbi:hypothetical protein [Streptomyces sp. NPDC088400]|uniref:hypothetical protein n=1 Tax=Streptomyces sp. NPDC088400 TaxID=3365861 RepID=UPI00380C17DD